MNYDNYNNLPNELKQKGYFCVAENKIPIKSRVNDINTFDSFDDALKEAKDKNLELGIGLFGKLCGIDIDNCVDDLEPDSLAKEIISKVQSYTEYSPSRKGIHIYFYCDEIDQFNHNAKGFITKNKANGVEIYQGSIDNRYLRVSGDVYNQNYKIRTVTKEQIEKLFKDYMRQKDLNYEVKAKTVNETKTIESKISIIPTKEDEDYLKIGLSKDNKLIELLNQDSSKVDQSSHDLKILNKLAYWCNKNEILMRKAFEESAYFKSKDEYHLKKWDREDYSSNTIALAVSNIKLTAKNIINSVNGEETKNNFHSKEYSKVEQLQANTKQESQEKMEEYKNRNGLNGLKRFNQRIFDLASYEPISSGYDELDKALGGGLFEGLYTIGAPTSLGKTTFVQNIVDNAARGGCDVLYFALEMSEHEMISKSISKLSAQQSLLDNGDMTLAETSLNIRTPKYRDKFTKKQRENLDKAVEEYKKFCEHIFYYEGAGDVTIETIKDAVNLHQKIYNKSPLVVIDYLQLLAPREKEKRETQKQIMDNAVLELKRLSRDMNIPIICISSLNRDSYSSSSANKGKVYMNAFKETGAIEYTSSYLIGLEFSNAGKKDFDEEVERSRDVRMINCVIMKNRYYKSNQTVEFEYTPMFDLYQVHKSY